MPRLINLTLPLYPHMPVGNVWAWDTPFIREPIKTIAEHGAYLEHYRFHSETGTRLMMRATYDPSAPRLGEIDFTCLVNRETVVIDIPKEACDEITAADIEGKVVTDPEYRDGDMLLIRTGWGNDERYLKIGDDYAINTPHFSDDGSRRLSEAMRQKNSDILAIDVAYIGNCGRYYQRKEWVSLPPWQRPPWPSEQAKIYLRHYTPEKVHTDWTASEPLHDAGLVLAALCNLNKITRKRISLTALPLFLATCAGAPVTVIAIEH